MKNLLRAIVAWIGAKKMSGGRCGCATIFFFILLYWLLGYVFKML